MDNQKEVLRQLNLQIHSGFEKEESNRINLANENIDSEDDVVKEVAKLRNMAVHKIRGNPLTLRPATENEKITSNRKQLFIC